MKTLLTIAVFTFILIASLVFGYTVLAAPTCDTKTTSETILEKKDVNTKVPSSLKGAKIIVRTSDGKESEVKAEEYKLVPRKQQFMVTKTKEIEKISCQPTVVEKFTEVERLVEVPVYNKNRISLMAGNGPKDGLNRSVSTTLVDIESRVGAVGGLQYQRLITDTVNLGIQGQTNKSFFLSIGLDF